MCVHTCDTAVHEKRYDLQHDLYGAVQDFLEDFPRGEHRSGRPNSNIWPARGVWMGVMRGTLELVTCLFYKKQALHYPRTVAVLCYGGGQAPGYVPFARAGSYSRVTLMPTRGHTLVSLSTFRANARAASKLPVALRELPYSPSVTWSSRS